MAVHDLARWQHDHAYDMGNRAAELRTWIVVAITAVTMVAEIVAGCITGSMALAIAALASGLWLGWSWLDPLMGIVGAGVILWWSKGLLGDSARVLLDREMDDPLVREIRKAIEVDGDAEIADLHVGGGWAAPATPRSS
jgi:Co/Zn/Cd efflux system component